MTDAARRERRMRLTALLTIIALVVGAGGGVLIFWLMA